MILTNYEAKRIGEKIILDGSGCWLWRAGKNDGGYARCWFRGNQNQRVHILMYRVYVGEVPNGLVLDHTCRVRHCINPFHLEPKTIGANVLSGDTLPAKQLLRTHCPKGHEYNVANTYITKKGTRDCRACGREQAKEYRRRLSSLA